MTSQELQILKNQYDIIGNDPALNRALEIAVAVSATDLTVLVSGESGVGKETLPKIIHQKSHRKTGKYFAVNCGAIPEGTIDSELFGHEKGSFTGATEMRRGYFEEANGGTLFLDEIGELPLASQAKLLRVLQSGEYIRVGSSKVMKTDVRVIAATNVNLMHAVSKGKFREDLYYRLNAVSITMPPLRERQDDIHLLFRKFASDFSERYGIGKATLTPEAVALLKHYRWPGNIRQLKNVAETVCALEAGRISAKVEIGADVLSTYIPKDPTEVMVVGRGGEEGMNASEKEAIIRMILQLRQEVDYLKAIIAEGGAAPVIHQPMLQSPRQIEDLDEQTSSAVQDLDEQQTFEQQTYQEDAPRQTHDDLSIDRAKDELIRRALEKHGGNRKLAAAELGMSERTLYRKLKNIEEK